MRLSKKRHTIKTVAQLEEEVIAILKALTKEQCQRYVDGMMKRMEAVVKVNGDQIGKWFSMHFELWSE